MLNQKGAIQFIVLLILLAGIAAAVYLVTAGPLKLFPKAASAPISAPIVEPISTPTPEPPRSGGGGRGGRRSVPSPSTTSTPIPVTIKQFRVAEDPTGFADAKWQIYTPGVTATHTFSDSPTCSSPCLKFIFIQFGDGNGQVVKLNNGQEYISNSIELVVTAQGGSPAQNPAPVSTIPSPLSNDGPNCPIENPKPFDIGTLYTLCSVNQLTRFGLKYLVDFPNEILIDIGTRKGDLGGFLANFSGERLIGAPPYSGSGFSTEILKQLPEWRKQQLPGYIYEQIK